MELIHEHLTDEKQLKLSQLQFLKEKYQKRIMLRLGCLCEKICLVRAKAHLTAVIDTIHDPLEFFNIENDYRHRSPPPPYHQHRSSSAIHNEPPPILVICCSEDIIWNTSIAQFNLVYIIHVVKSEVCIFLIYIKLLIQICLIFYRSKLTTRRVGLYPIRSSVKYLAFSDSIAPD
ncbi:Hypothetical predicted protein [Octopus vulgaris]|uniref:Uncharacterized protein n=1 Tax=Octopus vulgaris TaxID=6645 RepID=A0AA36EWI1_OCTVU|nr:Hypothetical predicted protein [Octopus vulgaris]